MKFADAHRQREDFRSHQSAYVSLFHLTDEAVTVSLPASILDFRVRSIRAGVSDIIPDGIVKKKYVLVYHRNLFQYTLCGNMVNGFTSNRNCPARCFIIFCNQVQNSRFARARVSENGRELLIWHRKGGVFLQVHREHTQNLHCQM